MHPPPKEPRAEGVKLIGMPPVVEDRPRGISTALNGSNFAPTQRFVRHKVSCVHPNAIAQSQRDIQAKLEKRMGEKKHREDLEERNMLALCSLGDKSYKRPEHSPGFFNLQLHPRHLNIGSNNDAMESSRRQATDMDNDDPGTPHVQTTYETKKKIQMLLEEKAGVTLLSTSKAGQLSWEDCTGNRTWVKKTSNGPAQDGRDEDDTG
ncbi:hypothetical protein H310_01997 [Aphanomyces invadans]|uniref:Uncharacterized protein n=1 Tax=Aphanomyces invadans TaxID=157072 RepID=A0A024UMH8_9STRA|nr:hypothetical protein H310_01997 [Aphanomyces invadans]ETW07489.1 hypothetical protein H310_01997 [Aphanomyces invadans]|eukprot:XP_008863582.1 hypothetical protein H310_01997 [Aphanomyces invadans]